ncbi:polysaccharide deacetylase family protein [Flavobacterium aquiphilum]|uniref:polysaccharide deacetylase family protein n=1 Tax=Flavobacterium aquiphilum TaxID=3003261 RepID=UPI002480F7EC|nr:polysaccharide deacetylase family protein [Flavobacterium aquiphilum]
MLTVSNYHYIRQEYNDPYPSIFGMTPNGFRKQLLLLKKQGDFISPINLAANVKEALESKDNRILITFDDGLKEQFDFALPILDELNIPAIFFVNSSNFEDKKVSTVHKIHLLRSIISSSEFLKKISNVSFSDFEKIKARNIYIYDDNESAILKYILNFKLDFNEQEKVVNNLFDNYFDEKTVLDSLYMSEKNLKDLAKNGFLGGHSHNHYPLGLLEKNIIKFELENSKRYLEKLTDSKIDMVSYPYGTPETSNGKVAELAEKAGYKIGFTTTRGINTVAENHLLLKRFDCNDLAGGKKYNEKK